MERNWDPAVKKFFLKILNSVSIFLFWMITSATAGIYFKLGFFSTRPVIYVVLFYAAILLSLFFLIRYLYNNWKDFKEQD